MYLGGCRRDGKNGHREKDLPRKEGYYIEGGRAEGVTKIQGETRGEQGIKSGRNAIGKK